VPFKFDPRSFHNASSAFDAGSSGASTSHASSVGHGADLLSGSVARFVMIKFAAWALFLVGLLIVSWMLYPVLLNWNPQERNVALAIGGTIVGAIVVASLAPIGLTLLGALFLADPFFEQTEGGNAYFRVIGAGTVRELKTKSAITGIVFCISALFAYWLVIWLRFN
jgi:hypothetical protein